jgi:hypothetical protein
LDAIEALTLVRHIDAITSNQNRKKVRSNGNAAMVKPVASAPFSDFGR